MRSLQQATHFRQAADGMWEACAPRDRGARQIGLLQVPPQQLRTPEVTVAHFERVLRTARPSVGKDDHAQFERSVEQALQPTRDLLRNQHQLAKFNIGKASWKVSWGFQAYEILRRTNSVNHETVEKLHGIVKEAIA